MGRRSNHSMVHHRLSMRSHRTKLVWVNGHQAHSAVGSLHRHAAVVDRRQSTVRPGIRKPSPSRASARSKSTPLRSREDMATAGSGGFLVARSLGVSVGTEQLLKRLSTTRRATVANTFSRVAITTAIGPMILTGWGYRLVALRLNFDSFAAELNPVLLVLVFLNVSTA